MEGCFEWEGGGDPHEDAVEDQDVDVVTGEYAANAFGGGGRWYKRSKRT